jgi:hypothetical protein
MSKYRNDLTNRLNRTLGKECGDVIDELYRIGAIDDTIARRGCIMHEYLVQAPNTALSTTQILSEISENYHISERGACKILYKLTR